MADVILSTNGLCKSFGGVMAINHVSLEIESGKIHALIGANGAGKTTFLQLLTGLQKVERGSIIFEGKNITKASMSHRSRAGMAYALQTPEVFGNLTLAENMNLAGADLNLLQRLCHGIDFSQLASHLNHGHRKLLQFAMTLGQNPKLLILDEPTQGLSGGDIALFLNLLKDYARQGAVLLVEHNMDVVMGIADTISVLHFGEILQTGTADEIRISEQVQDIYLGRAHVKN